PASANAQPAIPAPDTSHGSVAYAAPTGRQKSGNPGEERKSVLHNHLAGKVLSRDSAAYAAVDHNQSSSLEQNKPAAPVAAMAKKENDNEVKLKNSEPAAVSKAAGARDNDALPSPAGTFVNTFSGKVVDIQNRGVPNAVVMMNN